MITLTRSHICGLLPARSSGAHKGSCGKVFIVAGSSGMLGAAILSARACLRSGAGLVYLGVPRHTAAVVDVVIPEVIICPLPQTRHGTIHFTALPVIKKQLRRSDVLVIGPGLSSHPHTRRMIRKVIHFVDTHHPLKTVIDADALAVIQPKRGYHFPGVLTPHIGELARMCKIAISTVTENRERTVSALARTLGLVVIAKGYKTAVSNESGKVSVNPTGNAGMATAGSGDVLAGVIGALLGQGLDPYCASKAGVYIHGLAGDLARDRKTEYGLIASDIIDSLPDAFKKVISTSPS